MKAVVMTAVGEADVLDVRDVPDPTPAAGEVVLEVHSAALNHLDIWVRRGARQGLDLPWIIGSDAAGVVAECGAGVEGVSAGQEVVLNAGLDCEDPRFPDGQEHRLVSNIVGMVRPGTFAEKVAVPAYVLHPKPEHLSFAQAAAMSLDHLTAWRMLFSRAKLRAGETLLVHGIGGGAALAALQLGRLAGAMVFVTSSSKDKLAKATELGAKAGIDYTHQDVADAVLDLTDGRGVDVICDSVGAATWETNFRAARRGGRIVHCGVTSGSEATADIRVLYWKQLSVLGSTMGSQEEFAALLSAVEANGLEPVIDSTWPMEKIREATGRMERGEQFGKIVLDCAPD